jgi:hypothetical protein
VHGDFHLENKQLTFPCLENKTELTFFIMSQRKVVNKIFLVTGYKDYLKLEIFFLQMFILTCQQKTTTNVLKAQPLTSLFSSEPYKKAFTFYNIVINEYS